MSSAAGAKDSAFPKSQSQADAALIALVNRMSAVDPNRKSDPELTDTMKQEAVKVLDDLVQEKEKVEKGSGVRLKVLEPLLLKELEGEYKPRDIRRLLGQKKLASTLVHSVASTISLLAAKEKWDNTTAKLQSEAIPAGRESSKGMDARVRVLEDEMKERKK